MPDSARPRDFQAPSADGGKLVAPPAEATGGLIAAHRANLAQSNYDLHGQTLENLAAQARHELLSEALAYTRTYRDISVANRNCDRPLLPSFVLAGHQPELFHPGVWLKHFVLDEVARRNGAVAINLVVDSDTIKTSSLRIPTGSVEQPSVQAVPFDRPSSAIPYEERRIVDRALFDSFGRRACDKLAGLVRRPLLSSFWPQVVGRSRVSDHLGECLAQARHALEGRWGTNTLEIPQSRVCSLPAFHRFAAHLLAHLPRLWDLYNAALEEYRRANHVRSHAHPVPALATSGDWLEAPFWVWRAGEPTRRALFVRSRGDDLVLSDRAGWEQSLTLSPDRDLDRAVEHLQDLAKRGVRLRTRALITTLLARLLLGDLFIHGIGGAKYDQMTDVLIERFFGMTPPQYMVVSGTLRLPIPYRRGASHEINRARQDLRQLTFQPERFLEPRTAPPSLSNVEAEPWRSVALKYRWVQTPKTPSNARVRHHAIRAANETLQPFVADQRARLLARLEGFAHAARAESVLSSREYSFCLFPEAQLREFLGSG